MHVWYGAGEAGGYREDLALLGREEKLRGARIARDDERSWFIAARAGTRRALAEHLRVGPERIGLHWDPASDFRAALLTVGPGARPLAVATVHHARRWLLALAPDGPLALSMAAAGELPRAADRLRADARRVAAARARHLAGAAFVVRDLPAHGPAAVALARPAGTGTVHCHGLVLATFVAPPACRPHDGTRQGGDGTRQGG
ncbi:hypothetical protein ACFWUQ_00315 [Streptomyces sp. NPDC058662]|uniref:hypothetical protein n=1 Tax=Streptomyces sp. NPDC058662 TaxID=3346583 RepID=UPI00365A3BF8